VTEGLAAPAVANRGLPRRFHSTISGHVCPLLRWQNSASEAAS
jgi:hypothetical protein